VALPGRSVAPVVTGVLNTVRWCAHAHSCWLLILTTISCGRRLWTHGLLEEEWWLAAGRPKGATGGGRPRSLDPARSVVEVEVELEVEVEVDAEPRDSASNPARTVTVTVMMTTVAPNVRRLRNRALTTPG
jgi:hypothetical protein